MIYSATMGTLVSYCAALGELAGGNFRAMPGKGVGVPNQEGFDEKYCGGLWWLLSILHVT